MCITRGGPKGKTYPLFEALHSRYHSVENFCGFNWVPITKSRLCKLGRCGLNDPKLALDMLLRVPKVLAKGLIGHLDIAE
jgi:hypothetical protein